MANNFQQWQDDWENKLPDDIEQKVLHHATTLSTFGRVMELFVPNALQTAARLIAGNKNAPGPRRPADTRYSDPVIPEGRPPSGGGKDERLLPTDEESI